LRQGQPTAAQNTSIPTTTHQTQACDTVGSASSISISCNGTSNNNVANSPNSSTGIGWQFLSHL